MNDQPHFRRRPLRLALGVVLVAGILAALFVLPTRDHFLAALDTARQWGPLGALGLALLYVPAALLLVPGTILTLGAGFALGVAWGTAAASLGGTLGAVAGFLAGRTLARDLVEARAARSPKFAALDRAVGKQGFKIVLLTRLSPIFPYNVLNYAYGLTRISLRDYALASWIGMLPGAVVYVYLGSAVKSLADLAAGRVEGGVGRTALFLVGLAATVAAAVTIGRVAQQELNKAMREEASPVDRA